MDKQKKGVIIGASVGVLAGAIAAILFAPKSGKETRDGITDYVHEIKDKIAEELTKVGDATKETYNGIIEKIVSVYKSEEKITAEAAKDIQDKLDKNFNHVMKTLKSKKAVEVKKASKE